MNYLSDILEQPRVLRSIVESYQDDEIWRSLSEKGLEKPCQQVVLTGMGSSFYALFPTWLYLNQQGLPAIHIEASELVHYGLEMLTERTLLVIVSQSGESVEIRHLVEAVKGKLTTVSITNEANNFLASHSSVSLCTRAGAEVPVATKTYTGCLALLHLLARSLIGRLGSQNYTDLLNVADQLAVLLKTWVNWLEPAVEHLQSASFLSLLGRGPAVASAMTGALMLKEAARLNAVGLSGGQFRHGPMEAVSPEVGVILLANQGRTWELSQRLATDIASHGGRVVLVGQEIADPAVVNLPLPTTDEFLSPILEILAVQLLANQFAERAGIIPGQFRWSGKVIHTE